MLVKNYRAMQFASLMGDSYFDCKNYSGVTTQYITSNATGNLRVLTGTSDANGGLTLGSDATPATENDFQIISRITNVSLVSQRFEKVTSDKYIMSATFTATADILISEVGFRLNLQGQPALLLAREVFDSPMPISNGDTFTVSMAIG